MSTDAASDMYCALFGMISPESTLAASVATSAEVFSLLAIVGHPLLGVDDVPLGGEHRLAVGVTPARRTSAGYSGGRRSSARPPVLRGPASSCYGGGIVASLLGTNVGGLLGESNAHGAVSKAQPVTLHVARGASERLTPSMVSAARCISRSGRLLAQEGIQGVLGIICLDVASGSVSFLSTNRRLQ